jgi:predicted DNA-binding transcriptional regulator AlpA
VSAVTFDLPDEVIEEIARRAAAIAASSAQPVAEPWLNIKQAAAHLAISTSQLYTYCAQRDREGLPGHGLPVKKEGSRSYFKASELDKWRTSR